MLEYFAVSTLILFLLVFATKMGWLKNFGFTKAETKTSPLHNPYYLIVFAVSLSFPIFAVVLVVAVLFWSYSMFIRKLAAYFEGKFKAKIEANAVPTIEEKVKVILEESPKEPPTK